MPIPVLIAARNEAKYIDATLAALPSDCEPTLLVNGCTDSTPLIASRYDNVALMIREEAGKLPALQAGLRALGKRAAEPLIMLDGDTRPIWRNQWLTALQRATKDEDRPAFLIGPAMFDYADPASRIVKSAIHAINQWKTRNNPAASGYGGCNTIANFRGDTLEQVLALPHIWPGEDAAMKDVVRDHDGQVGKLQDPRAVVLTSADRIPSLWQRLGMNREEVDAQIRDSYLAEAPPGSIPYLEYKAQKAQQHSGPAQSHLEKAA